MSGNANNNISLAIQDVSFAPINTYEHMKTICIIIKKSLWRLARKEWLLRSEWMVPTSSLSHTFVTLSKWTMTIKTVMVLSTQHWLGDWRRQWQSTKTMPNILILSLIMHISCTLKRWVQGDNFSAFWVRVIVTLMDFGPNSEDMHSHPYTKPPHTFTEVTGTHECTRS